MVVLVARRPILDRSDRVFAYSMAFRGREGTPHLPGGGPDPERGARRAYQQLDLHGLADSNPIFLPLSADAVRSGAPRGLPPDAVVLCVPAAGGADPAFVAAVAKLAGAGYRIAACADGCEAIDGALIPHLQFALLALDPDDEGADVPAANPGDLRAAGVEAVATGVTDADARERATARGFTLFRGSYLAAPPLGDHPLPRSHNSATMLALIAELNDPDFDLERAHRLIRTDPALSYMLLRYINSAFFSLPRDVESIRQAVMLLGSDHIRRFVSIVALARLGEARPDELLRVAVLRARLCELLAPRRGPELFTAGLFSVLDSLLGVPMSRALEDLPLSSELRQALLAGCGPLAPYLALARGYHEGRWDRVARLVRRLKLDVGRLPAHYREAVGWADAVFDIQGDSS